MHTRTAPGLLVFEGEDGSTTLLRPSANGSRAHIVDLADGIVRIRELAYEGGRWIVRHDATLESVVTTPIVEAGEEIVEIFAGMMRGTSARCLPRAA